MTVEGLLLTKLRWPRFWPTLMSHWSISLVYNTR